VRLDLATAGTILYIAVLVSIGAVVLLNTAIAHIGPGRAGTVFDLMPVFTAALAVALLGGSLQSFHLAGTALVFAGLYVATRRGRDAGA
jgi:drug/metabolite transporter (DMT)-like permease